jgi:Type I restriction enzyme R protein N terminus (HSDR_N)
MSEAPKPIIDLIERFERNIESYHNTTYNETQVRQEFINPFFEALGWDITNKTRQDKMVTLVKHMPDLHKLLKIATTPDNTTRLQRQIDATDKQIDQLVYELYGLTDEEIRIVEEAEGHGRKSPEREAGYAKR